jgi:23S rRNA (cytosine1962-C5)-methyltransferase
MSRIIELLKRGLVQHSSRLTNGDNNLNQVILKKGRAKPALHRHPWIFSGAVDRITGDPTDGDPVQVRDAGDNFVAYGLLNRRSQIVVRLVSWEKNLAPDTTFWRRCLKRALAGRTALATDPTTTAYRLVHAEADGLPGLIVDCYSDYLVVQFLILGMERRKDEIADLLMEIATPRGIVERSDAPVRAKEGLPLTTGLLRGIPPPDRLQVLENGHRFLVDVSGGQKTGFYLDQRANRQRVSAYCTAQTVLDAFCYSGGFSVYAATAGASSLTLVDSSANALSLAQENVRLNGREAGNDQYLAADVFQQLRRFRAEGRSFDVVILDPPKFARSQASVQRAARGYKDVNLLAMQLLHSGGILATFSCSGLVSADLFQKIVFGAAVDARRDVHILERLTQGPDHPILLTFPESEYLKGLLCRVW